MSKHPLRHRHPRLPPTCIPLLLNGRKQETYSRGTAMAVDERILLSSVFAVLEEVDDQVSKSFEQRTIYRVHESIRIQDPRAYDPQIISIGPYHHGHRHLQYMERLKHQFFRDLLHRHPSNTVDKYTKIFSSTSFVEDASKCYSEPVVKPNCSNKFAEIMLFDCCFIIEFLAGSFLGDKTGELDAGNWNRSLVEMDLLLLENQIPFWVLQSLYDVTVIPNLPESITLPRLVFSCLLRNINTGTQMGHTVPNPTHHLLHLCYSFLCPVPKHLEPAFNGSMPRMIPRATRLHGSKVKFRVKKKATTLFDITFKNGILEMPHLSVQPAMASMIKNFVAFEQSFALTGTYFTSYVTLLDNLIDMPEDVELLERSGILDSNLGGNKDVARFFNRLGRGVYLDYDFHSFMNLFEQVMEFCGSEPPQWLKKEVDSLTAVAIFLLVLTIVQTFFTVLPYFRPAS